MTDRFKFNAELAEQIRAEKHRKATEALTELNQEKLNGNFQALGAVAIRVEAGDRNAMLELLKITADSLLWFELLPRQTREELADGLKIMRVNLETSKGFLPRGRGERSEKQKRNQIAEEYGTARLLEYLRRTKTLTIEDAKAMVVDITGMTESLVHKRWSRHHQAVEKEFDSVTAENIAVILESVELNLPITMDAMLKSLGFGLREKPRKNKRRS